jgi:transposase
MERIHVNYYTDIIYRIRSGESERQIARDLGICRPTVHKYKLKAQAEGFLAEAEMPVTPKVAESLGPAAQPPKTPSSVAPYHEVVQHYVDQGLEMTAIFQRLKEQYGYTGSYSSVRRYVPQFKPVEVEAFVRMHCAAGEEMQVDFGNVGDLFDPQTGKVRPAYAFVATLSHSRHQYAELVFDQKTATWIGLHQRAFEAFGGVTRRVVLDNLKAGVIKALVIDPVLGEAYRKLAQHYHFLVSPNKPRTPRHKGKVENGVHYLQRNFMAGQQFVDLPSANQHLRIWVCKAARHHPPSAAGGLSRGGTTCPAALAGGALHFMGNPHGQSPSRLPYCGGLQLLFGPLPAGGPHGGGAHPRAGAAHLCRTGIAAHPSALSAQRAVAHRNGRLPALQSRILDPHPGLLPPTG